MKIHVQSLHKNRLFASWASDLVARKIKIMPYYVCWEVSNFTGMFWIGTNSAISVYLLTLTDIHLTGS